jgi:hypothetical protein
MTTADRRTMQALLDRPLDELLEELDLYAPTRKGLGSTWKDIEAAVRQRLCVEWRWCELRQDARWDDKVTLALAVASALSQPVLQLPFPADLTLIAVIGVKMGLDWLCGCR